MDDVREKLIKLLGGDMCKDRFCCDGCEYENDDHGCLEHIKQRMADHLISNGVVIPVRCNECKHWKHIDHVGCSDLAKVCMLSNYMIGANGYCLYGERK